MSQPVFHGVLYYISETLPLPKRTELTQVLDTRGATPVPLSHPNLTHFITSSLALEDFVESLPDESAVHIVTPRWVERSASLASLQDPEFFSADPAYLFSGVTAAATDLSQSDCELISAAITALGGQWRTALTRDVTHLFALAPGSAKYETAMHYREQTGVCVLVPHWFDDTVRLGIRDLPTRNYEWPEPRVFHQRPEGRTSQEDEDYEPSSERMMLYDTASLSNDEQRETRAASRDVWKGKRLLLGLSLDLSDQQRKALHADIRRQGGEVVELSSSKSLKSIERVREELANLDDADVFVTRYRTGAAYAKAYEQKKTIGTLAWLWYVRASGTLTRPADQLLHYPIPDKPADGFDKEVITVTNYTGKDREYLKKLITLMGGEFTASMSAERNTVVVAAYLHGTKTDKATSWSIPIVNHTWVEDCFVQWRRLTPARDKYIVFPPGVDFSTVLAERGLGRIAWEPGQLEEMQRVADEIQGQGRANGDKEIGIDAEEADPSSKRQKSKSKSKSKSASPGKTKAKKNQRATKAADDDDDEEVQAPGTAQSVGEVEDAVAMDEAEISLGAQMDVDADFSNLDIRSGRARGPEDMDVDGAVPSRTPPVTKTGPPSRRAVREKLRDDAVAVPVKRRLVRRYTPRKTDDEGDAETAKAGASASTPSPKRPARTYGSTRARRSAKDDDIEMDGRPSEDDVPMAKTKEKDKDKGKKAAGARAGREKEQASPQSKKLEVIDLASSDSDSDSTGDEMRSVLGDLVPNRKGKARGGASTAATKASSSSRTGQTRTPQRLDSVLVPSVASAYSSPTKQGGKAEALRAPQVPLKVGPPKKTTRKKPGPTRAASPRGSAHSRPPSPAPAVREDVHVHVNAEAGPSRARTSASASGSASPAKLLRTPSRRSAATKATRKLHDVIMPDVISFQKEMKNGTVRAVHERERRGAEEVLLKSAAKVVGKTPMKGRKRRSIGSEGVDGGEKDEEEEEEMPEKKKRRTNEAGGVGKGKRKSTAESEEPESVEAGPPKKSGNAAATANGATAETRSVRIMTTQLTLAEDVTKALTKLGVKFVAKPADCTHLLVRSVVRTEKFLCAMAVAPHVLGEKWAVMSAFNRKLLPEAEYAIKDEETEKKYGFKLADALKRAKKNSGKLFGGMTFYVTPKVPVETKLLKNVVTANGGQLLTQTPTVRILSGHSNRFVISCPEDVSIWRPLAQHHRIYTQELILTSALKQVVDWEDTAHQVQGSY